MPKKTKKQTNSLAINSDAFHEGDIVAAKVKGYPWWPGRIEKVNHSKRNFVVRFYFSEDTSNVTIKNIKYFEELNEKEKSCNKKGFQDAYKIGQKEYNNLKSTKKIKDEKDEEEEEEDDDDNDDDDEDDNSSNISAPIPEPLSPAPIKYKLDHSSEKTVCKDKTPPPYDVVDTTALDLKTSRDDRNQRTSTKQKKTKDASTQDKVNVGENNLKSSTECKKAKFEKYKLEVDDDITASSTESCKKKEAMIKLREKLAMKEREKQELMNKKREKLYREKLLKKLDCIKDRIRFESKKISELKSNPKNDQIDLCQMTVRHENTLNWFGKAHDYMQKYKIEASEKYLECHETLVSLKQLLSETERNNHLSKNIRKYLRKIKQSIDGSNLMKSMALDDPKNAMTERKENDAK